VAGAAAVASAAESQPPAPIRNPLTANIRPYAGPGVIPAPPATDVDPDSVYALRSAETGAPALSRRSELWVETPPVAPGETLGVDIHVAPVAGGKSRGRRVEFSVFTMAAEDLAGHVKEWKVNVVLGDS
jgi:hypothetical protein